MASAITLSEIGNDILDSRDLDDLLESLRDEREDLAEELNDAMSEYEKARDGVDDSDDELEEAKEALEKAEDALANFDDDHERLIADLQDASEEISEWSDGATLILDTYWVEYVQEMCEDVGYISKDFPWWIEIDWEKTAENVKMDYTEVEIDGNTYYARS
jgi:predicted nuclease with TOPRIM domain